MCELDLFDLLPAVSHLSVLMASRTGAGEMVRRDRIHEAGGFVLIADDSDAALERERLYPIPVVRQWASANLLPTLSKQWEEQKEECHHK